MARLPDVAPPWQGGRDHGTQAGSELSPTEGLAVPQVSVSPAPVAAVTVKSVASEEPEEGVPDDRIWVEESRRRTLPRRARWFLVAGTAVLLGALVMGRVSGHRPEPAVAVAEELVIGEDELARLTAYIKSLGPQRGGDRG